MRFRLVSALLRSNNPTSSFVVLLLDAWVLVFVFTCLRVPRYIVGCYFYSRKNRLLDMASFRLCYNFNKYTSD
jgi:hypothetical protein